MDERSVGNPHRFVLEESLDGGRTWMAHEGEFLPENVPHDEFGRPLFRAVRSNLDPLMTLAFRVRAVGNGHLSPPSAEMTVTTLRAPRKPWHKRVREFLEEGASALLARAPDQR